MDLYRYKVQLLVEVDAFEETDARDVVEEYFGGDGLGSIAIVSSEIELDGVS